eukprot:UN15594
MSISNIGTTKMQKPIVFVCLVDLEKYEKTNESHPNYCENEFLSL